MVLVAVANEVAQPIVKPIPVIFVKNTSMNFPIANWYRKLGRCTISQPSKSITPVLQWITVLALYATGATSAAPIGAQVTRKDTTVTTRSTQRILPPSKAPVLTKACSLATPPSTRPEITTFFETSTSDDVNTFLQALKPFTPTYTYGVLGTTTKGRAIPYVIASRPRIATAKEARKSGRPIVYLNGNIHGGEVEGKEAMLAMLRDLACDKSPNVLDSLILIVVPNYNSDGNDQMADQSVNRSEQNGPKLVGTRSNSESLNLNRDYVEAAAPETQASLAMLNAWDPHVYVDLHATDGSYHGYALTYSQSLVPGAPLAPYTRELLRTLRTRVRDRHGYETFDYGNFDNERSLLDTLKDGWFTFDSRPRFGSNYVGLRGRIAILTEAFSHDPFQRRIASTSAFVSELLSLVAERRAEIRQKIRVTDDHPITEISLRTKMTTTPAEAVVLVEILERAKEGDTSPEPGVPAGVVRTGRIVEQRMPVYDHFVSTYGVNRPAGYLISRADTVILKQLALHGITAVPVKFSRRFNAVQFFTMDSVVLAPQTSRGHRQARVTGQWSKASSYTVSTDMMYVETTTQRLGSLAVYLLEPESEDGLVTWSFFNTALQTGAQFPVIRVLRP